MGKRYPVVTLCGSNQFIEQVQEKLTLRGNIVITSVLQEDMDAGRLLSHRKMLADMHRSKIDMADAIFVMNPTGEISEAVWSDIRYAWMLGKRIDSMMPISLGEIADRVRGACEKAKKYAAEQHDWLAHVGPYHDPEKVVSFMYKGHWIVNPWLKYDAQNENFTWGCMDGNKINVDPFEHYGRKKAARYIEDILRMVERI